MYIGDIYPFLPSSILSIYPVTYKSLTDGAVHYTEIDVIVEFINVGALGVLGTAPYAI